MEEKGQNTNERATLYRSVHHVALITEEQFVSVYLFDLRERSLTIGGEGS